MKIFFTADQHWCHKRIIEYENREFSIVEEMNETMILCWNEVVDKNDLIFHLGDFSLGKSQDTKDIFNQLNGNIILVLGNHDRHKSLTYWKEKVGFMNAYKEPIDTGKFILSHEPVINPEKINIHGHVHSQTFNYYDERFHKCVSVERHNYYPVLLENLL